MATITELENVKKLLTVMMLDRIEAGVTLSIENDLIRTVLKNELYGFGLFDALDVVDKLLTQKKKSKYVRFLPCTCGCNRRECWSRDNGFFYKCMKCGVRGGHATTVSGAKKAWNDMINNLKGE